MDINVNASKKFNIDFSTLTILYRHYKEYFLPIGIILASFVVLLFVVVPQIQGYFNAENNLKEEENKLELLKNNFNLLSNLNQTEAEANLSMLKRTLPPSKDFAGVLNAITSSASDTGVSVGDFTFQVGDLAQVLQGVTAYPSLQITVNLNGNVLALNNFMNKLYHSMPLAEVTSIKVNQTTSILTVLFYYKPFPPAQARGDLAILPLSAKDKIVLSDIANWNPGIDISLPLIPDLTQTDLSSSQSAVGDANSSPF
jgi:Tfp pilus assembly protein PilO